MTRSLHLCNLANVAYGYSKILRQAGREAALGCHDLKHLMSQPEWDDLELASEDFPNEFDFYDTKADFGDYQRPAWFHSGPLSVDPASSPPAPFATATAAPRPRWNGTSPVTLTSALGHRLKPLVPGPIKDQFRHVWRRLLFQQQAKRHPDQGRDVIAQYNRIADERFPELIAYAEQLGESWQINKRQLYQFHPHAWWLHSQLANVDVVMAYVLTPIYAMIVGDRPYVSIEIGTMREIPFDGTDVGKLLALAYRRSPHVLITNPDVIDAAHRLGVERYSFCPHPLDEDLYARPTEPLNIREQLLAEYDAEVILFAPARQNWRLKGNHLYLRAFARLLASGVRAVLVIPGWGQEVERSQNLCEELGISHKVLWIKPQSERVLVKYYASADFVLDQFVLGVFGLITPKALSCGAAVVTSFRDEPHRWCFEEMPPVVRANTEEEIYQEIRRLIESPEQLRAVRQASREWVCKYHSKAAILSRLEEAMDSAQEAFGKQYA